MANSRWTRVLPLLVAAMAAGPGGARAGDGEAPPSDGWTRVFGKGWATPDGPLATNDPPAGWMHDGWAHDPQVGVDFTGLRYYELNQGAHKDNKSDWRSTDYIRWKVGGASLVAWGQIHDEDPERASIVTSSMWGAERIHARISPARAEKGWIRGLNVIFFSYGYLISGQKIAEASVQLAGNAYDILGRHHVFHLNDHHSEQVEEEVEEVHGLTSRDYGRLKVSFLNGEATDDGGRAEAGGEETEYSQLKVNVTRRLAAAGGENGTTPEVEIHHMISGDAPLEFVYRAYSDARVVLRARAGGGGPVLVKLDQYRVQNDLKVWMALSDLPDPDYGARQADPETGEPMDGDTDDGLDHDADGAGDGVQRTLPWQHLAGLDEAAVRLEVVAPHALEAEEGSLPGFVAVRLDAPAPRELVFRATSDPPGRLVFADDGRVVVPEGAASGTVDLHAASAGPVGLVLALLDADGLDSGAELRYDFATSAAAQCPDLELWAAVPGTPWQPGRGTSVVGVAGADVGPLAVGRLAFAGLDEATVVAVAVEDPAGVLEALPAQVVLAAGATRTEVPLRLTTAEGSATVVLTSGDARVEVAVRSVAQSWEPVDSVVRVPLGAIVHAAARLERPERVDRAVTASPDTPCLSCVGDPAATMLAGETVCFARVQGVAPGAGVVTLTSPGLSPLALSVEVLPVTWAASRTGLVLSGLAPTASGRIEIVAPPGTAFAQATLPADADDYLVVGGLDTSRLSLTFSPSPDVPATLTLSLALDDAPEGEFRLQVLDGAHAEDPDGPPLRYTLVVP